MPSASAIAARSTVTPEGALPHGRPAAGRAFDPGCAACPRLAGFLAEQRVALPAHHNAPVPAFGDPSSRLLVVGLAPGLHGANRTGRPFTGDHAGILLYQTLFDHGFASAPVSDHAADGLRLLDARISNAVRCVPPENKPEPAEVRRCNAYLVHDLASHPAGGVVIALGTIAHQAVLDALGLRRAAYAFAHGAQHALPDGRLLIDSYHCSRYNTSTKRLTAEMFAAVFAAARAHLGLVR
ncbi:MAG: uracil-DNA glycosylase [Betaproteobacteria bacterium]|nr:uracil-DNA glycosylase [Betaproteobacteria bacterium]